MSRIVPSLLAVASAMLIVAPALAADYGDTSDWSDDTGNGGMRSSYGGTEPADWSNYNDPSDSLSFEGGIRYWYSMGSQDYGSGSLTSTDTSQIGELHLRIEDHHTNTFAKAIAGYSMVMDGSYSGKLGSGSIADGHVAYVGADFGWNAFGDNNGSGIGPMAGYLFWDDRPDTGRFNYTTETDSAAIQWDTTTGQTFLKGASAANNVYAHLMQLGVSGKAKLGDWFDISGDVAAVPYAQIKGTVGIEDPTFSTAIYNGPAQLPYDAVANGNIYSIRSSPTTIDGWGYGATAEGWLGVHPTDNMTFRLGGRLWYLQGTVDATYSRATITDPSNQDANPDYETGPTFTNASVIDTNNPFRMFRYGILGEFTYAF